MTAVSLVITTFNRADLLIRALNSVYAQTRMPAEIIVIDDGSVDDTAEMITRSFPKVVYRYQDNKGISEARNHGIKIANYDWIAFLDDDDEWLPGKLAEQLTVVEASPDSTWLVHTDEIWIRNHRRVNPMKKHRKTGGKIFEYCLPMCVISPSSVLVRKNILVEAGFFDKELPACEDYDMWLKLCARYQVSFVDKPLVIKHGGHSDQLSHKHWGMDRFRIQSLVNLLKCNFLTTEQKLQTRIQLARKTSIYLNGAYKRGKHKEIHYYTSLLESLGIHQRDLKALLAIPGTASD